jgi:hypothetical protein
MPSPEPTLQTKWGRLTGAQWLEARHREAMEAWWTPEVEAYVVENCPTPEQLAVNQRHWAQKKRADRARKATAQGIASVARADRARPGSDFQPQAARPTQLSIL